MSAREERHDLLEQVRAALDRAPFAEAISLPAMTISRAAARRVERILMREGRK